MASMREAPKTNLCEQKSRTIRKPVGGIQEGQARTFLVLAAENGNFVLLGARRGSQSQQDRDCPRIRSPPSGE
jgi:hypothetical protein